MLNLKLDLSAQDIVDGLDNMQDLQELLYAVQMRVNRIENILERHPVNKGEPEEEYIVRARSVKGLIPFRKTLSIAYRYG